MLFFKEGDKFEEVEGEKIEKEEIGEEKVKIKEDEKFEEKVVEKDEDKK